MNSLNLNQFLLKMKHYQRRIDSALMAELNRHKESAFFDPLVQALKGGKRLRPVLLVLSYEAVGGKDANPLPAAVAVELVHTGSLIHDDIIDRDHLRREAHAFYALHGHEMALLSVDFVLSVILGLTSRYNDPRISNALAEAISRMSEGELAELEVHKRKQSLTEDRYIEVISNKTASLFEASANIGATIGGGTTQEVEALSEFGSLLGTAYQIQDDMSDLDKASINISNLLKTDSDRDFVLKKMLRSHVDGAKRKLERLDENEAKTLLVGLASYVGSKGIGGI